MNDLKKTIVFALLTTLLANVVLATTPRPGEPEPEPDALFGFQVVIDPEHIATTLQQIAVDQARKALAERALSLLAAIPFSDDKNFTGAFLANMEYVYGGFDTPVESIAFVQDNIEIILDEIFPGWARFERRATDFLGPLDSVRDWERMLYTVRHEELTRILVLLKEHSAQLSRERQGLFVQRLVHGVADGNVEHLQLISAGIQQLADAQSVSRQLEMIRLNTEIVDRLEERSRRAHRRAAVLEILDAWAPKNGSVPQMSSRGITVTG